MSYIGNAPISAAFLTDTFSGTGSQTAFTMTVAPANTSSIIVAITGVLQDPSTYSVSGTTLTFSAAPPSGTSNISVRYLGIPASGVTTTAYRTVTNTTATAGQTSFTIPSYTVGYVDVYRNGVYLPSADYTATTGTTVVLNNAATVGDTITTISFYVSSVLNAIPATANSVARTYMPVGSVLQTVQLQNSTYYSGTVGSEAVIFSVGTITPTTATSKIAIFSSVPVGLIGTFANYAVNCLVRRGTTTSGSLIQKARIGQYQASTANREFYLPVSFVGLDSPSTTSAISYCFSLENLDGNPTYIVNGNGGVSNFILQEIAA